MARKLGISTPAAYKRVHILHNPEAIKIAVQIELDKRKEQAEAEAQLQKLSQQPN